MFAASDFIIYVLFFLLGSTEQRCREKPKGSNCFLLTLRVARHCPLALQSFGFVKQEWRLLSELVFVTLPTRWHYQHGQGFLRSKSVWNNKQHIAFNPSKSRPLCFIVICFISTHINLISFSPSTDDHNFFRTLLISKS